MATALDIALLDLCATVRRACPHRPRADQRDMARAVAGVLKAARATEPVARPLRTEPTMDLTDANALVHAFLRAGGELRVLAEALHRTQAQRQIERISG